MTPTRPRLEAVPSKSSALVVERDSIHRCASSDFVDDAVAQIAIGSARMPEKVHEVAGAV